MRQRWKIHALMRTVAFVTLMILSSGFLLQGGDHDCPAYPASTWSFNPETLKDQSETQGLMTTTLASSVPDTNFSAILTRQNFVDEYIFDKLAAEGVQSAGLASDEEFMRRVTLDLIGRP